MSYAYNANCMNQFAIEYISEHLGEKTGWVVMDYAGLHTNNIGSQIMRANIVFYSILTFPLSVFEYEMLKRAYAPSSSVFL